jgi:hypothetical protein
VLRSLLACAATTAVLALSPAALADGDPASDTLYVSDVYYPYQPHVTASLRHKLDRAVKQSRKAGYGFKIALIQTEADLGAYPALFNHPQQYAKLLSKEIAFGDEKPHLLVVMPRGFGGRALPKGWQRSLRDVHITTSAESNGLAAAAIRAVRALRPG